MSGLIRSDKGNYYFMEKYFAYGSNMLPGVMESLCDKVTILGRAKLDDHRLAFTRRAIKTGSGVADIVPSKGLCVWGVLFEIDKKCLDKRLDLKEGRGFAYDRKEVVVKLDGNEKYEKSAITYNVIEPKHSEIAPSSEYLNKLIAGAEQYLSHTHYVDFLKSFSVEGSEKDNFRVGFLAKPTESRQKASGMPLVLISDHLKDEFPEKRYGIISYKDKICPVRFAYDQKIASNECFIDQSIRSALRIKGWEGFGTFVNINSSIAKTHSLTLFKPRTLVLPCRKPSYLDAEKEICVLHGNHIKMLGVEEGDYVNIQSAVEREDGNYEINNISRRVFSGTAEKILRDYHEEVPYPRTGEFYLDLDGRLELGVKKGKIKFPVFVAPNLRKLFISRILYYGFALFIGILALTPIFEEFSVALKRPKWVGVLTGILVGVFVSLLLTILDLRSRVQS